MEPDILQASKTDYRLVRQGDGDKRDIPLRNCTHAEAIACFESMAHTFQIQEITGWIKLYIVGNKKPIRKESFDFRPIEPEYESTHDVPIPFDLVYAFQALERGMNGVDIILYTKHGDKWVHRNHMDAEELIEKLFEAHPEWARAVVPTKAK